MNRLFNPIYSEDMKLPVKMHIDDAGYDCYLPVSINIKAKSTSLINLGFSINMPKGYCAYINLRSSIAKTGLIAHNIPIDEGYKGPVHLIAYNSNDKDLVFNKGDRICQIVIFKVYSDGSHILSTERGSGAFGSTNGGINE